MNLLKSIMNLEPPEELSEIIKNNEYKNLKVYIDLKNVSVGLFVENILQETVNNTEDLKSIDTSWFQSILYWSAYWKYFGIKNNLKTEIYISSDSGDSCYHHSINKKYKHRRKLAKTLLPEYHDLITEIKLKNSSLMESVLNKIPHLHFIYLKYLESDFIPYYLITRKFNKENDTLHCILSSDKDMYQALLDTNIIQICKIKGNKYLLNSENCLLQYIKANKIEDVNKQNKQIDMVNKIDANLIPLLMSFVGDNSDDIIGVPKIGPKKAIQLVSNLREVNKLFGTFDDIDNRLHNGESLFIKDVNDLLLSEINSEWKKVYEAEISDNIVSKAYKQISYFLLCKWLERRNTTEKIGYLNYIDSILNKENTIKDVKTLFNGLNDKIPEFQINEKQLSTFYYENFKD